jgi:hypothetical protein
MADIPQNPFDKEALDKLEDAVDLSRALVDNANQLKSALLKSGQILDKEFGSATKSISKRLNDIATQFGKLSIDEFKRSDALKAQKKLADDLNNLVREKKKIEDSVVPAVRQQYADAKSAYDFIKQQLGAKTALTVTEQEQLDLAKQAYEEAKQSLVVTNDTLQATEQLITATQEQNDQLETYIERWNQVNLKMGIFGRAMKGLKKIPILGDLLNTDKALKAMEKSALKGENAFKTMGKGISAAFEGIEKSTVILAVISAIVKVAKFFVDLMFEADKQITEIGRELLVTRDAAVQVRDRLGDMADAINIGASSMGELPAHMIIFRKETVAAQSTLNSLFGTTVDYTQALGESGRVMLEQFTAVSKMMRLTEEEQKGLAQTQVQTGKDASEFEKTTIATAVLYKNQTGYLINQRKVLGDVLKTSNAVKLTIKGGTDSLIKSVINAQHLGINLEKVKEITSGLLDFESSIQAQMEAELLTGRQINLDKLRYAVLTNDTVTQTEELNRLVREGGANLLKNRIAMESYAKAAGVSVEEFSDMYTQQLAIEKSKVAINKLGTSEVEKIIKQQRLTADIAKQLREGTLGGTTLYNILKTAGKSTSDFFTAETEQALAQQSAQEKFNAAIERAKEIFSGFVDGGYLQKLADTLIDVIATLQGTSKGALQSQGVANRLIEKAQTQEEKQRIEKLKATAGEEVGGLKKLWGLISAPIGVYNYIKGRKARAAQEELQGMEAQNTAPNTINAQDFTIKTLPQDTIKIAGGTKLGETDNKILKQLEIQNQYLAIIAAKDQTTVLKLDNQTLANGVAKAVPMSYGNLLNPAVQAYT